jgi:hypothetical protein
MSSMVESSVMLPGCGEPVVLPKGWTIATENGALALIGPEEDLRLTLLVAPAGENPEDTAREAWQRVDSGFALPVLQKIEVPSSRGWDKVFQSFTRPPLRLERQLFSFCERSAEKHTSC